MEPQELFHVSCLFTFQNVLQVFHYDTKTFSISKQKHKWRRKRKTF